ncbi:MAG TPA: hypothetical protein VN758_08595 [Solirubrobacterales bacterium]|nr:hypothetical protein [Solirubrobacterales bacterium]
MDSRSKKILAVIIALCVVCACAYIAIAALGPNQTTTDAQPRVGAALANTDLMVRAVDPKEPTLNGRVYVLDDGHLRKQSGELACERVYFAAGHGICMGVAPSGVEYTASVFNSKLQREHTIALTGLPSRTRVSPDGRYGAMTVFVTGDSYLSSPTAFSTRTSILEMASGRQVGQLEQFKVEKDGVPFDAVDFNFWGVTFDPNDSDHFYATLGTGGDHYLVEGSISGEKMTVLREGVECPSLSPDGAQIAYKSRIGNEAHWHLRVLDVATLDDHPVAEERSIDDQVEWLDNDTLVYSDGRNVYTAPADGSGASAVLVRDATSPVRLDQSGQELAHSQR